MTVILDGSRIEREEKERSGPAAAEETDDREGEGAVPLPRHAMTDFHSHLIPLVHLVSPSVPFQILGCVVIGYMSWVLASSVTVSRFLDGTLVSECANGDRGVKFDSTRSAGP